MMIAILLAFLSVDDGIRRLPPSSYDQLPSEIRVALNDAGCTIPQHYGDGKPHNVIRGEFTNAGVVDWAVLCSREGISVVMVFSGSKRYELNPRPDVEFIQGIGGDRLGFSRLIEIAEPELIREYFEYHGDKPPHLDHHGIDDVFDPKASVVHYFDDEKWHHWAGAD